MKIDPSLDLAKLASIFSLLKEACFAVLIVHSFTALHGVQTRSSDEGNRPLSQRSSIAKGRHRKITGSLLVIIVAYIQEIQCASTRTTLT